MFTISISLYLFNPVMKSVKSVLDKNRTVPSTKRGLQEGYNRVTFLVKDDLAYKLNCIASIDDIFLKEVVNEALEKYILTWETKNRKIPIKKLK